MSDRLITIGEVSKIVGFGRTYIYYSIKKGEFPSPYKIGKKTSRWSEKEINEWVEKQKNDSAA